MDRKTNGNPNIKCSVSSCAYHTPATGGLCTLQGISVGCTQQNVTKCDCTECASFKLGDHGTDCGCK